MDFRTSFSGPYDPDVMEGFKREIAEYLSGQVVRGVWTPTLIGTTTAGSHTYAEQVGRYARIGKVVFVEFFLVLSAKDGTMAGDVRVAGFPFTLSSDSLTPGIAVSFFRTIDLTAGYSQICLRGVPSTKQFSLLQAGDNVSEIAIAAAGIGNASGIGGSGLYTI